MTEWGRGRVELYCWTDFNHCNLEDGIVPVLSRSWDLKSQGSLGDFCDISRSAGATVPGNSSLLSKWTSSQSMVAALSQGTFTFLETLRLEDASTWPALSSLQISRKDRHIWDLGIWKQKRHFWTILGFPTVRTRWTSPRTWGLVKVGKASSSGFSPATILSLNVEN